MLTPPPTIRNASTDLKPPQGSHDLNWPFERIPKGEKPTYGHPELERRDYCTLKTILREHPIKAGTSVDVFDAEPGDTAHIVHKRDLNHEQLVAHLESGRNTWAPPVLRIMFLNETTVVPVDPKPSESPYGTQLALHPSTIYYFIKHMGVHPGFFINILATPTLLKAGNAMFMTYQKDGRTAASIQGFFSYTTNGVTGNAWFKHDLDRGTSFYILEGCPAGAKASILEWGRAWGAGYRNLDIRRPFALETLIFNEVIWGISGAIAHTDHNFLKYEGLNLEACGGEQLNSAVLELYTLSKAFHIAEEALDTVTEQLHYLHQVWEHLRPGAPKWDLGGWANSRFKKNKSFAGDSLWFLLTKTRTLSRRANSLQKRADVQIGLFTNILSMKLAAEVPNRFPTRIALALPFLLLGSFVAGISIPVAHLQQVFSVIIDAYRYLANNGWRLEIWLGLLFPFFLLGRYRGTLRSIVINWIARMCATWTAWSMKQAEAFLQSKNSASIETQSQHTPEPIAAPVPQRNLEAYTQELWDWEFSNSERARRSNSYNVSPSEPAEIYDTPSTPYMPSFDSPIQEAPKLPSLDSSAQDAPNMAFPWLTPGPSSPLVLTDSEPTPLSAPSPDPWNYNYQPEYTSHQPYFPGYNGTPPPPTPRMSRPGVLPYSEDGTSLNPWGVYGRHPSAPTPRDKGATRRMSFQSKAILQQRYHGRIGLGAPGQPQGKHA
ncbi:hypothetical protein DFP72DRAFT_1041821 [Ephemerocybe angulata]|uniref:Uncharacterized protein n=1 Tax=Ephemerocybe angulata TaxID=980116 RepID=A0A8H6I9X3_9AGAR|nr:hypothetical protein DFP72DRAFT_1041821 [Tulosesus angulatus]